MYTMDWADSPSVAYLTVLTSPTTVTSQGSPRKWRCLPSGSWPGQALSASARLTTATTHQIDPRRGEEAGANGYDWCELAVARVGEIRVFGKSGALKAAAEGSVIGDAGACHKRKRFEAFKDIAVEGFGLRLGIFFGAEVHKHHEFMLNFEAGINLLSIAQAVDEEAGSRESDERQGNLHHNQNSTEAIPARATCRGSG